MKASLWVASVAVAGAAAFIKIAYLSEPIASYSFLLTDWFGRPDMVSQCMIKLNRGTDPQEQDVWKAMGIKDPATQPYVGRLHFCYEGFRGWQHAFRPQAG